MVMRAALKYGLYLSPSTQCGLKAPIIGMLHNRILRGRFSHAAVLGLADSVLIVVMLAYRLCTCEQNVYFGGSTPVLPDRYLGLFQVPGGGPLEKPPGPVDELPLVSR